MRGKYHFREPLLTDDNGLYVTAAQMQFFLNRPKGKVMFKTSHYEFLQYYKNCCLYNLVYDMMEKNDKCAKMYWDSDEGCVALSFPVKGFVAEALSKVSSSFGDDYEDEDDDDSFGIFK